MWLIQASVLFCSFSLCLAFYTNATANKNMKIAIVGAGPAGIISGKYCMEAGFDCDIFEQIGEVGGTWVYTDEIGVDKNGFPVHSSMYKNLRTNLPKELMYFWDFPYPKDLGRSYIKQLQVQQYFQNFTEHFGIIKNIKFFRHVKLIESLEGNRWLVKTVNVKDKSEEEGIYHAVIICNGHYEVPNIPKIPGASKFEGNQCHSHSYRSPEPFKGQKVILIGAGPSGLDISKLISSVTTKTILSCNSPPVKVVSENVTVKPALKEISSHSVKFADETVEDVDCILYCTGYLYSYPFLAKSCGIDVINGRWVKPLYKHIINIEHPTMGFIGVPYAISVMPLFEVQARFFLSTLTGHFHLPSKEIMLEDLNSDIAARKAQNLLPKHMHQFGSPEVQASYFNDLSTTANIDPVPEVFNKLYKDVRDTERKRNETICYNIIDADTFEKLSCDTDNEES